MGRPKKQQKLSDFYREKTKGIGQENTVLLKLAFHFLPQRVKYKIENFQSFLKTKQKQEQYKDKNVLYIVDNDKAINKEFNDLVNLICENSQIPKKLFFEAISRVILYDKYHKVPVTNFLYSRTEESVVFELFRKPKTDDWDMMKLQVELDFEKMSHVSNIRISPRHAKTIDRRLKTIKSKNFYDALDELVGEDSKEDEGKSKDKLSQQVRNDRHRLKKIVTSSKS